jgi:hypothetical protein
MDHAMGDTMTRLVGEGACVVGRHGCDDRGRCVREPDGCRDVRASDSRGPGLLGWLAFFAFTLVGQKIWRWGEGMVAGTAGWVFGGLLAMLVLQAFATALSIPKNRRQRRELLDAGRCPGCGSSIAELEPQADGCRVCPECGSAWKLDGSAVGSAS